MAKPSLPNSLMMYLTDGTEIKRVIKNMKNNKAPGIDEITAEMLKKNCGLYPTSLTHIINNCLGKGNFPKLMKEAVIKAVYKSGDKLNPSNYRSKSLMSVLSKIFEK